jgi:hypothetical protein
VSKGCYTTEKEAILNKTRKHGRNGQIPRQILDIFFIYISNAILKVPYTLPLPCFPTHPLPLLALAFPCAGAYKVCNTKGPLFPVMVD